jgi:hypothetical protein
MKNNIFLNRLMVDEFDDSFEKINFTRHKKDLEYRSQNNDRTSRVIYDRQNFKCVQCGVFVTAIRELSGVNNRNHCPFCLWSRHMDHLTPGDRKSDCLSRMQPVGLTMKQIHKRYGQNHQGELMLIHLCTGCGKVSINRIAADDDTLEIFKTYVNSFVTGEVIRNSLISEGISMLSTMDHDLIQTQLFGSNEFLERK